VDNSKTVSWAKRHLRAAAFRQTYVHLIRDPRAVVWSWQSRGREKGPAEWVDGNRRIREFLQAEQLDWRLVTYSDVAERTERVLGSLCAWLGITFEAGQIEYWNADHHGPGRNGANAAYLRSVQTPDEGFYREHRRTRFQDLRWRERLDPSVRRAIEEDRHVNDLLGDLGLRLSDSGLEQVATPLP
jgi:hypothetical protein